MNPTLPSKPPVSEAGHGQPADPAATGPIRKVAVHTERAAVELPEPSASAPIYNALHEMFTARRQPGPDRDPGSTGADHKPPAGDDAPAPAPAPADPPVTPGPPQTLVDGTSVDRYVPRRATAATLAGLREATAALRAAYPASDRTTAPHTGVSPGADRDAAMLSATHDLVDAMGALLHRELAAADPGRNDNLTKLATIAGGIRDLTTRSELPTHEQGPNTAAH